MQLETARAPERGQLLVVMGVGVATLLMLAGLVLDGGYALVQRRGAQNASDFAALGGARIVASWIAGDTTNGTDANVQAAISAAVATNGGEAISFGAPDGPIYITGSGGPNGFVGAGSIPAGSVGVKVRSGRTWTPLSLGAIGGSDWRVSAEAIAKGGYRAGGPSGPVFPVAIAESYFSTYPMCSGPISADPTDPCYPQHLTPGNLNVPGGFGWLKFGCQGYGLGQGNEGGCENNTPFLNEEIGPPGNSFGCCTDVGLPGSADKIGSLPGNKASADCQYYIDNQVIVNVAVWDIAGGSGSNAWYHIIGFAAFQITACPGAKNLQGVWRRPITAGPTTTVPGFPGTPLAVQLIR